MNSRFADLRIGELQLLVYALASIDHPWAGVKALLEQEVADALDAAIAAEEPAA